MKFKKPSRATTTLLIVIAGFVATTMFAQKFAVAKPEDETTARLVAKLITRYHISQGKIDDKISAKMFDRYLKQLDPRKLYFTKADIDEFSKSRTILDDQIQEGNVKFAYQVFDRYRTRVGERVAMAQRLLKEKYDFQKPGDSILIDAKSRSWAATDTEIHKRWRTRVKADILSLKLSDKPMPDVLEQLRKRYVNIQRGIRQTSKIDILEIYLSSLTHAFDPHSSYMSPETVEDFEILMKLRLQGIGASLRSIDGYTVVVNIVEDGAADKDGRLKKDDKIIGVDSKADGKMIDIVEMKLSKVVRLIRGPKGTKVLLKVLKADKIDKKTGKTIAKGKTVEILLVRRIIQLKSSEVKGEIIDGAQRIGGRASRIGVINIPSFYRDFEGARLGVKNFKSTSRDVRRVLAEFRAKGPLDLLVIDLRFNGGGSLTESIEVSGLFIDKGPVVQVRRLHDQPRSHDDLDAGTSYDGPLLIICNRMSASASEIFAGVIKDYKRGIIVGDKSTHGKGTVQNVMTVGRQMFRFLKPSKRGALKLTIQQFFRVNGDSTQNRGVESDVVLPSLFDHMDLGESFLENALKFSRVPPAKFQALHLVNAKIIRYLRERSAMRVKNDKKFQETVVEINRYLKRKNRKTLTLYEPKRREQKSREKKDSDLDKSRIDDQGRGPIFPAGHYNDEVLRIGVQYAELLKTNAKTARK
ncbi:MAG: carboxy terminal-processing peptidase [Planctomycetes bacterium]|nr:carboxy terminal-processing peptidase [Planctomycetota bacterium]